PDLQEPHGLTFLDSDTLIVANRAGTLPLFRLPPQGSASGSITLHAEPTAGDTAFRDVVSPGSVAATPVGRDCYQVFVCNNFAHRVTRHRLKWARSPKIRKNKVLIAAGLSIPDGIAVSPSERWIAISNHTTGSVLIYRNNRALGPETLPVGRLEDAGYPHGVRFTRDGQFIFVADAGTPVVNVYLGIGGDWRGTRKPIHSIRVLTDEAYLRGHVNPEEGGPKGIDIDGGGRVLATTCEEQPLAFFDLRATLNAIARRTA
ncbi:MAG TPA: hypothetical protein VFK86_13650, partial [Bauldia sp.]|nr:hypothetical protein [Bauldia sp.]